MAKLTVISLNVKGLNSAFKRASILDFLHRQKVDIALLQETHLRSVDERKMQNKYYKAIVASSDGSKTKGVMILMKCNTNIQVVKIMSSLSGRWAYCCATLQKEKIAFISIYGPTTHEVNFFPLLTKELLSLNDYALIIGADMNMNEYLFGPAHG